MHDEITPFDDRYYEPTIEWLNGNPNTHIFLLRDDHPPLGMLKGWYFTDEEEEPEGPFPTLDAAHSALAVYCRDCNG